MLFCSNSTNEKVATITGKNDLNVPNNTQSQYLYKMSKPIQHTNCHTLLTTVWEIESTVKVCIKYTFETMRIKTTQNNDSDEMYESKKNKLIRLEFFFLYKNILLKKKIFYVGIDGLFGNLTMRRYNSMSLMYETT